MREFSTSKNVFFFFWTNYSCYQPFNSLEAGMLPSLTSTGEQPSCKMQIPLVTEKPFLPHSWYWCKWVFFHPSTPICQPSSHKSIFFIKDLPHLHIRYYQSQPQREASPSAFSLVDNWPVPQECLRMDKILHIWIPGSTYGCSITGYQKNPAKPTQSKQKTPQITQHFIATEGYLPFMLFWHHSHSVMITAHCPFGSCALRGVVYVLPLQKWPSHLLWANSEHMGSHCTGS